MLLGKANTKKNHSYSLGHSLFVFVLDTITALPSSIFLPTLHNMITLNISSVVVE